MAVRLSLALNTSSEMWINMQSMYDLWQAEKKRKKLRVTIRKIKNRDLHFTAILAKNKS
jgi:plasmid maintenance system antidote protein VapI